MGGFFYIIYKPGAGITFVKARFDSMYGEINSAWHQTQDEMEVAVKIPPNTTATVILPEASAAEVIDINSTDVIKYEQVAEGVKLELGSGAYIFRYQTNNS